MASHTWALILAGGNGRRLAEVTGGVPKQFWRVKGESTLLDRTLDRLAPLAPPERTVVVVDQAHEPYVRSLDRPIGHVLYQPQDRGTAVGVLLAILPILDLDSDAVVALSPADHAVADFRDFRNGLLSTVRLVRRRRSGIVLFGAEPQGFDESYGWIEPGRPSRPSWLREVTGFVEKPGPDKASALLAAGAVWNTMVLVAGATSLLDLFAARQPELTSALVEAWQSSAELRDTALADTYDRLQGLDFSRDVLTGAGGLTVFTWPASMGWSDLGTPDRLHAWLEAPVRPDRAATSAA
jgi:mannose-1-phosphate guanylyltransferase